MKMKFLVAFPLILGLSAFGVACGGPTGEVEEGVGDEEVLEEEPLEEEPLEDEELEEPEEADE